MLAQRVATAAVGIPLIILVIIIGGPLYVALVAAALAIATLEFQHPRNGWFQPISLLAAGFVAAMAIGASQRADWVLWFAIGAVVATLASSLVNFDADRMLHDWLWAIGGVMYVGLLGSSLVLLRDFGDGREWVMLALFSTFAVDTAAYFTGRAFGRRKLAPTISPNKTIEGFIGGYIGGLIAVVALNYWLDLRVEAWQAVLLGLLLPIAATVGDLAESAIKRSMRIKDTSELIPGHGGVLDRLDSVLFTFTLVYLFVRWFVA